MVADSDPQSVRKIRELIAVDTHPRLIFLQFGFGVSFERGIVLHPVYVQFAVRRGPELNIERVDEMLDTARDNQNGFRPRFSPVIAVYEQVIVFHVRFACAARIPTGKNSALWCNGDGRTTLKMTDAFIVFFIRRIQQQVAGDFICIFVHNDSHLSFESRCVFLDFSTKEMRCKCFNVLLFSK